MFSIIIENHVVVLAQSFLFVFLPERLKQDNIRSVAEVLFMVCINMSMTINTQTLQVAFSVVCLIPIFVMDVNEPSVKGIVDMNPAMLASVIPPFTVCLAYLFPAVNIAKDIVLRAKVCLSQA